MEYNAHRVFPVSTPVASMIYRTASKIRFGAVDAANRRRQCISVVA